MADAPMTPLNQFLHRADIPPGWLALFIAIAWLQSWLVPIWDAGGLGDWLGGAFILAGIVLMVASLAQFAQARTSVIPRREARVLITGGVYQLSRNPIYVADALILTGLGLRWDLGALIWVVAFVMVIDQRFINGEEAGLRAKFGAQFDDWAEKTRRWV